MGTSRCCFIRQVRRHVPSWSQLTHRNLCASAFNVRAALKLAESDRCLNVMPLFHIHGLVGAVLSSLAAGPLCIRQF
jgi:acyl-CoA synthetase (AMP-forming)/AMP-acid ligase II